MKVDAIVERDADNLIPHLPVVSAVRSLLGLG